MTTYNLVRSPQYYDGVTLGKDQDGFLVVGDSSETDRHPGIGLLKNARILTGVIPLTQSLFFDNTVTVGKDNDGVLATGAYGKTSEDRGSIGFLKTTHPLGLHRRLRISPFYDDGTTIGRDQDGALRIGNVADEQPVSGMLQAKIPLDPEPLEGSSTASAVAQVQKVAEASIQGTASTYAEGWPAVYVDASVNGSATASATPTLYKQSRAPSDLVWLGEATAVEAAAIGDSPGIRYPWSPLEDLAPNDRLEIGGLSDLATNNRVQVLDPATLKRDPTYSGPDYVLGGPPDDSASPKQLGYKVGEQLRLIGPVGGETHDGRILTLADPNSWSVYEVLDPSDTTWYQFQLVRSVN